MSKFIYLFNRDARDKLLSLGFTILKNNEKDNIFVFENSQTMNFSLSNEEFVFSDTISF